MRFVDLGVMEFEKAYELQCRTVEAVADGEEETVFLLEHPHVYTLGRRGALENLVSPRDPEGNPIVSRRINRGGDITYHGPGQLVGYPHLDLRSRRCDLHRYLRGLEEVLIRTASRFGVAAWRREGLTGVWTAEGKLASIGVGVRRWVTLHGFALNVSTDLRFFQVIHPCGIPACPVTSLASSIGTEVRMEQAKSVVRSEFAACFAQD